jgi:hypothetical protein
MSSNLLFIHPSKGGRLVATFTETYKQLATSSWTMCRILSYIKPTSMDAGQTELRTFSTNNQYTAVFARDMKKLGLQDMTLTTRIRQRSPEGGAAKVAHP